LLQKDETSLAQKVETILDQKDEKGAQKIEIRGSER
jgi:hypothetical protein